ncbi:extracellular solute-binding protein [Agromyces protaetiae]|uniref:Extracellular solute-binding protein n=1 Tax=Agromyces protaetiae TaxID=2509455 RepID=A0A4V0YGU1_9MICO|nr:extracellular solute-binding protein [Agromyces protaetiae]QAY72391.1 extracellular solute-binding protein [Agromyces protaetiae]
MSRTPVAIAGAAATLLLLAGCSAPATQDDAQTLKYLFVQPENPETLDLVKADIAHFEELNPGVKVDMDVVPFDTLQSVLVPQLRSDSGPDVFIYDPGPGFAGALADAGLLYDLTDAFADNDWQTYQFAIDQVTFDGKIVGVPNEIEELGVFYNKDLFAEHGLEVPTSIDELEDASKSLLDDDIVPFAFGALDQWNGSHSFSMSLSSELGGDAVAAIVDGTQPIDTPETVATVERTFQEFLPFYPEFPTALSYDDALSMFYAGEAAMLPTGTWMVQDLSANADFEVGFFPYPATERQAIFSAGLGSGTFVSANTKKPELAVKFLDYLQSEERGLWQIENLQTIPAYPVDASGADISPLFQGILADAAGVASGDGEFGLNIDVRMPASFNDVLYPGIQAVLTGTQSSADFVKDLQAAIDAEAGK